MEPGMHTVIHRELPRSGKVFVKYEFLSEVAPIIEWCTQHGIEIRPATPEEINWEDDAELDRKSVV